MATMDKYNLKNPAMKRILQEIKEMQSSPSDDFMSLPLEWQFGIAGPRDSEFEGGIYHGRIQLPAEYPFKPPSFMLLTPNSRFETQTKICLSMSNHHPEHWQPSWSVRTALVALIAFMPTNPNGALGSLDFKKEERRALAVKSQEAAPRFGSPERQKLIDEIHEYLLTKVPPVPQPGKPALSDEHSAITQPEEAARPTEHEEAIQNHERNEIVEEPPRHVPERPILGHEFHQPQPLAQRRRVQRCLLTWATVGLMMAIAILLLKKLMKSSGYGAVFLDDS
ncbi:ubiquitin-conjugating enzyme E2 32-like isoform X1 [Punica granatum]|uniref:Ubiquitin-conjugating enzyme E2 32-like isoform X1 n=1 Tax=Punica granatum TaxID=22663 RepID=A0A6P8DDU5_PUNGR|nr:ubiquitin-conjugating enzyme E2 32-like isoform X1 [Punica granatum]